MKLIILDRDGVINEDSDEFIKSEDEWIAIPGSLAAIARLNHAGYRVVVATNQSGLARGLFDINALNAIHAKMHEQLTQYGGAIEAVFFCPHGPEDKCACRKPAPGMFHDISRRLRQPLYKTIVVGDKLSDINAALAVKARAMLVKTGKGQLTLDNNTLPDDVQISDNLSTLVDSLLAEG